MYGTRAIAAKLNSGIAIVVLHLRFSGQKSRGFTLRKPVPLLAATSWLLSNPCFRENTLTHSHEKSSPQSLVAITCLFSVGSRDKPRSLRFSVLLRIIEDGLLSPESEIFLPKIVNCKLREILFNLALTFCKRNSCEKKERQDNAFVSFIFLV